MIINFNLSKKATVDDMADRANEIAEEMVSEVSCTAEFNVLTMLGANLLSNGITNKAMSESNHNVKTARELIKAVIADYAVSLEAICQDHLDNIEKGTVDRVEMRDS